MLVSLSRVGAARQSLTKTLAMTGADVRTLLESVDLPDHPAGLPPVVLRADERTPGLFGVRMEGLWLGTPAARDELFPYLGAVFGALARRARLLGGAVHPTAVRLGPADGPAGSRPPAPLGGDRHELTAVDTVEQEVLANLLRRHSPVLIALAGRGTVGGPPDRIGSRWLADSREHLATRYLACADPRHLHRVRAEIRRRDGIADLVRMDVAPVGGEDGSPARVLVRCLDSQPSLADLRAQSVLLAALALHARRMVRSGRREANLPQRLIEENRARAVVQGMRARFVPAAGARGRAGAPVPARDAARQLLDELVPELSLLDATAEELFPLLAPLELPGLGLPPLRTQDLLALAAREGSAALAARGELLLTAPQPGGVLLETVRRQAAGRVELLLDGWRTALADAVAPRARPATEPAPAGAGRQGGAPDGRTPDGGDRSRGGRPRTGRGRTAQGGARPVDPDRDARGGGAPHRRDRRGGRPPQKGEA